MRALVICMCITARPVRGRRSTSLMANAAIAMRAGARIRLISFLCFSTLVKQRLSFTISPMTSSGMVIPGPRFPTWIHYFPRRVKGLRLYCGLRNSIRMKAAGGRQMDAFRLFVLRERLQVEYPLIFKSNGVLMNAYLEIARQGRNDWWRYLISFPAILVIWLFVGAIPVIGLMVYVSMDGDPATNFTGTGFVGVPVILEFLLTMSTFIPLLVATFFV